MILPIVILAALAYYFYRQAQKAGKYNNMSSDELFKRLWYLPVSQVVICGILIGFSYFAVRMCMENSQFVAPALKEHFGFFGTIGAELINENIASNLAPLLREADQLHGWTLYLFYASIASLAIQIYALKEQSLSGNVVIAMTLAVSVAAIVFAYRCGYLLNTATSVILNTETFGLFHLLGTDEAKAVAEGLQGACLFGAILLVQHFNHYNSIKRYYGEPVSDINPMSRFVRPTGNGETPQQKQPESLSQPSAPAGAASTNIWKWIAIAAAVALVIAIAIAVSSGGDDAPMPQSPQTESESEDFIEEIPEEGYDIPYDEDDYDDSEIDTVACF